MLSWGSPAGKTLRQVATSGFDFDEEFEAGLDLLLDALERCRGTP
jgi:hypothetical protein